MSSTSYLNSLLKTDLTEFAETSNLSDYAGLRKAELAEKLDSHLKRNATALQKVPSLSEYYKRLGATNRSPMKRIAEKVSDTVDGVIANVPVPATAKKTRRKTRSPTDDESVTTDAEGPLSALMKTPGQELSRRTSILASNIPLPPSPAVVTDAIDRQSKRIRTSISHAYDRTMFHEYSDLARDTMSSTVTINVLAIMFEFWGLEKQLLPNKRLTDIGPIPYVKSTSTPIMVPDLFQLLEHGFWAPFSFWLLTTVIAPALTSYFINLPLQQLPPHSAARRASIKSNPHVQFDPFVFNLTKGFVAYCVYALHFQIIEVAKNATVAQINSAVPGGYQGMLISSGIGAAVSLYEAVLKR